MPARPILLTPTQGERFNIIGGGVRMLIDGASSGGQCVMFEGPIPAGEGPPLHRHEHEDELFYVLDGTFKFQIDGQNLHRRKRRLRLRTPWHYPRLPKHRQNHRHAPHHLHPRRHRGAFPCRPNPPAGLPKTAPLDGPAPRRIHQTRNHLPRPASLGVRFSRAGTSTQGPRTSTGVILISLCRQVRISNNVL